MPDLPPVGRSRGDRLMRTAKQRISDVAPGDHGSAAGSDPCVGPSGGATQRGPARAPARVFRAYGVVAGQPGAAIDDRVHQVARVRAQDVDDVVRRLRPQLITHPSRSSSWVFLLL